MFLLLCFSSPGKKRYGGFALSLVLLSLLFSSLSFSVCRSSSSFSRPSGVAYLCSEQLAHRRPFVWLQVPCSKQTLLLNKHLPLKDKRLLMKFLQACHAMDTTSQLYQGWTSRVLLFLLAGSLDAATLPETCGNANMLFLDIKDMPFAEALVGQWRLSDELQQYVLHAIASVSTQVPVSS